MLPSLTIVLNVPERSIIAVASALRAVAVEDIMPRFMSRCTAESDEISMAVP